MVEPEGTTVVFKGDSHQALERISRESGQSKREITINALSLYQFVLEQIKLNSKRELAFVIDSEIEKTIVIPGGLSI